jgi:hypothetical protein
VTTPPEISLAGLTDVGRVRDANEDDYYVGRSIVAVADGMGGHLAGEVASKTALEPIRALDGRIFEDAPAAVAALCGTSGQLVDHPVLAPVGHPCSSADREGVSWQCSGGFSSGSTAGFR